MNIFAPASKSAKWIFDLSAFVLSVTAVIFLVVFALLAYSVVKFRRRRGEDGREPPQVYKSNQVELAWTIIPVLIVITLFLAEVDDSLFRNLDVEGAEASRFGPLD